MNVNIDNIDWSTINNLYCKDMPLSSLYKGSNLLWNREVYGWHVDPTISDPANAITYLKDAIGMTPAAMGSTTFNYGSWGNAFFMPKPCMLKYDGTVDYYLDPDDYTKKLDGTASDIDNSSYNGNAMMEWPLIWYKFESGTVEGECNFYVSNHQVDNGYKCWCNIDSNNNIVEHFYTAIYNVTGTDKARSLSGVQLTPANGNGSTTASTEETRAKANNTTTDVEWYLETFSQRVLISALAILMSKTLNDQSAFGQGLVGGGQAAKEAYVSGDLDNKGLFWGSTSTDTSAVKIFGMENWYGCVWRRTAGLIGTENGYAYKLTYGTADGSTATAYNFDGTDYKTVSGRPEGNAAISKMKAGDFGLLPLSTTGGSDSTYWAEYIYSWTEYALFGGASSSGLYAGALAVILNANIDSTSWNRSGSLSCIPTKKATYSLLEYITLPDDTGFITDITPKNTTRTEMDVRFSAVNPTNENAQCLFGLMRQPDASTSAYEYYNTFLRRHEILGATRNTAVFYAGQHNTYSWNHTTVSEINQIQIYDLPTTNYITVKLLKGSSAFGTYTCQNNIAVTDNNPTIGIGIGGRHVYRDDTQGGFLQPCNMGINKYIYAFRVYDDNDNLAYNLLPAERNDGVIGLLDVNNNKFYTNVGAGTIGKGGYIT